MTTVTVLTFILKGFAIALDLLHGFYPPSSLSSPPPPDNFFPILFSNRDNV